MSFFKGTKGEDVGNLFSALNESATGAAKGYMTRGAQAGANEVLDDPVLRKMYGQGGAMDQRGTDIQRARGEAGRLSRTGFSMQPEDYEAYGQASGNIARESGLQEGSLSQALASRGLQGSAMAGGAMSGLQGNKMEALRQSQRQIANDRMNTNMNRLQQTRSFMNQLTGQQSQDAGQYEQARQNKDTFAENKGKMGMGSLAMQQQQANEQAKQRAATSKKSGMSQLMPLIGAGAGAALGNPQIGMAAGTAAGGMME